MSTDGARLKLQAALSPCALHAEVLRAALADLPLRFVEADVPALDAGLRRILDQVALRFMTLQDRLGEKMLPGLLARSLDPLPEETPFVQKLHRLERLGAVPSVERWKSLREVRHGLAHAYPDHPALQAAAWNRLRAAADDVLAPWQAGRLRGTALPCWADSDRGAQPVMCGPGFVRDNSRP